MEHTLTIRLDDGLAQALSEEARQTGLSKGQIARDALASRLQSGPKLQVLGRYFGAMRGPKDLSTNKNYRRDWKKKQA
jgi:hypothetical protein